jgi:transposase
MSDFVQRTYIQSRTKLNLNSTEIHKELILIHRESAYSYRTVAKWNALFKDGRESLEDDPRSGAPVTKSTKSNIQRVEMLIEENPHITYEILQEETELSYGTLFSIIKNQLGFSKKASRWIPHHLTPENKKKRFEFAKAVLEKFNSGEWRTDQIVTGDECWIY